MKMVNEKVMYPANLTDCAWGFIDRNGNEVCDPVFSCARRFCDGLAAIEIDGKWGFIDSALNVVVKPQYRWVNDFSESRAVVCDEQGKLAVIDKNGDLIVNWGKFSVINSFSEGLASFELPTSNGAFGFFSLCGEVVIEPIYYRVSQFKCGRARACRAEHYFGNAVKYGYLGFEGSFVIPPQFTHCGQFSEELTYAAIEDKFKCVGVIDTFGNFVIPPLFQHIGDFSEGLAEYEERDGFGFINIKGERVIPARTSLFGVRSFKESRAVYWEDEDEALFGYINRSGVPITPTRFLEAEDFQDGLAKVVARDDNEGEDWYNAYIDLNGNTVWRQEY
jgi:hypothetical protein